MYTKILKTTSLQGNTDQTTASAGLDFWVECLSVQEGLGVVSVCTGGLGSPPTEIRCSSGHGEAGVSVHRDERGGVRVLRRASRVSGRHGPGRVATLTVLAAFCRGPSTHMVSNSSSRGSHGLF